ALSLVSRLREDDGDVARPLEDLRRAAAGAGPPALQRRPFVDVRGHDDEVVAVPMQVRARLRVRDRRPEDLLDVARDRALRERENRARLRHRATANEVGDEPRLARARADPLRLRADRLLLCLDGRHYLLTFAALSPAWPRNGRVGANSPSLCPTICSETKTGTCLRPSWTAIVCPTISGKIVEARDQVRTICFEPDALRDRIRSSSRSSTNGPFFELLLTSSPSRGDG